MMEIFALSLSVWLVLLLLWFAIRAVLFNIVAKAIISRDIDG